MKGELKLKCPLEINGKKVTKLKYNSEEISIILFAEAESQKSAAVTQKGNFSGAVELDYSMHLYLGMAAVIAVNPEIDFSDLSRIKGGQDVTTLMQLGRNFTTATAAENSSESNCEEQSENTQESSTPQSQN